MGGIPRNRGAPEATSRPDGHVGAHRSEVGAPYARRVDTELIDLVTGSRRVTDLSGHARRFVRDRGDGLLNVFVPHATAGLALFELGSGSDDDLDEVLDRLLPRDDRYRHRHGSPGHGADHLVPVLVSPSVTLPVAGGELLLGTWQSLALVDTNVDNPRRQVRLTFVPG